MNTLFMFVVLCLTAQAQAQAHTWCRDTCTSYDRTGQCVRLRIERRYEPRGPEWYPCDRGYTYYDQSYSYARRSPLPQGGHYGYQVYEQVTASQAAIRATEQWEADRVAEVNLAENRLNEALAAIAKLQKEITQLEAQVCALGEHNEALRATLTRTKARAQEAEVIMRRMITTPATTQEPAPTLEQEE